MPITKSFFYVQKVKNKKGFILTTMLFIALYLLLDILANGSLSKMFSSLGTLASMGHLVLDLIMAIISALIFDLTDPIGLKKSTKLTTSTQIIPTVVGFFGLLTFGCAPCVIGFFATIGLSLSIPTFANGNIILKVVALIVLIIGYYVTKYIVYTSTCARK